MRTMYLWFVGLLACVAAAWASPLYPPARNRVTFDHAKHGAPMACTDCHADALASASALDSMLPAEKMCARCHSIDRGAVVPTGCVLCHADGADGTVARRFAPPSGLTFSHAKHAIAPCGTCHGTGAAPTMPLMATCGACHDVQSPRATCATCHRASGDRLLRASLASGAILRPKDPTSSAAHGPTFARNHRVAAQLPTASCASCHRQDECVACHLGAETSSAIHPAGFDRAHAHEATRPTTNCQSCHRSQTFCIACHERSGLGQRANSAFVRGNQALGTFHESGWNTQHGRAARQRLDVCVSCHREEQCTVCHSAQMGSPSINPHGRGFASQAMCSSMRNANARMCLRCHTKSLPPCQ